MWSFDAGVTSFDDWFSIFLDCITRSLRYSQLFVFIAVHVSLLLLKP